MNRNSNYAGCGFGVAPCGRYAPAGAPAGKRPVPRVGNEPDCRPEETAGAVSARGGAGSGRAAGSYGLTGYPVGAVYAPIQTFEGIYDPAEALARGTIFAALDLPLSGVPGGTEGGGRRG